MVGEDGKPVQLRKRSPVQLRKRPSGKLGGKAAAVKRPAVVKRPALRILPFTEDVDPAGAAAQMGDQPEPDAEDVDPAGAAAQLVDQSGPEPDAEDVDTPMLTGPDGEDSTAPPLKARRLGGSKGTFAGRYEPASGPRRESFRSVRDAWHQMPAKQRGLQEKFYVFMMAKVKAGSTVEMALDEWKAK